MLRVDVPNDLALFALLLLLVHFSLFDFLLVLSTQQATQVHALEQPRVRHDERRERKKEIDARDFVGSSGGRPPSLSAHAAGPCSIS